MPGEGQLPRVLDGVRRRVILGATRQESCLICTSPYPEAHRLGGPAHQPAYLLPRSLVDAQRHRPAAGRGHFATAAPESDPPWVSGAGQTTTSRKSASSRNSAGTTRARALTSRSVRLRAYRW